MNVPALRIPLIGRGREVEEVRSALKRTDVRLLTVTGPPGVGKTRLAIEVAHSVSNAFEHGVHFVSLAPLQDADLVLIAVAQSLGLQPDRSGRPNVALSADTHLEQYLRHKHMLLILDNFEHVMPAGVSVSSLLAACPLLKVLVTSRERLRVSWEHAYLLGPFSQPEFATDIDILKAQPAVALFLDRAKAAMPDFTLTPANADAIAGICRHLDGLPLAIELAAGQIRTLSPKELAAHLARRFEVLTVGRLDSPARHRSLYDSIEWSYQLLSEGERSAFRRLAIFRGGFTLEGAKTVLRSPSIGQLLARLTSLVEKNLISAVRGRNDETRYFFLESLREFAEQEMDASGETADVHADHAAYFLTMAEGADVACNGPDQARWLDRIGDELDNFRAALQWGVEHDPAAAMRIAIGLQWFWEVRGYFIESHRWYEAALARAKNADAQLRAKALAAEGMILHWLNNAQSIRVSTEGLRLAKASTDYQTTAFCLRNLGLCALEKGDFSQAEACYSERLSLHERFGPPWAVANTLTHMAALARIQGDLDRAASLAMKNLKISRPLGHKRQIALGLGTLGRVALLREELARAVELLEESMAINRELGATSRVGRILEALGLVALRQRDLRRARKLAAESMSIQGRIGYTSGVAETMRLLGVVLAAENDPALAARWLGFAHAVLEDVGIVDWPVDQPDAAKLIASLHTRLGKAEFDRLWGEGRSQSVEQILREVETAFGESVAQTKHGIATLSARELQVATLVAEGLTNPELASRLHIGVRTAETHVENIMNKLGVHSRAQIAAWMAKQPSP